MNKSTSQTFNSFAFTPKILFILLLMAFVQNLFAQAPNITYGSGAITITPGVPVSLTPTNSGGEVPVNQYCKVSTFAGSTSGVFGTSGYTNGIGTAALFNNPRGMAFDASNNLYVADAGNNVIRKITPSGLVSTFAGSVTGTAGFQDGKDTSARFNSPYGLAFDQNGNLFVADYNNLAIRKITPAGVVSTYYKGLSAYFAPMGICFDAVDNLLAVLHSNNLEAEIASVPNFVAANNGLLFGAIYSSFVDIKTDAHGHLFVTDAKRNEISKFDINGVLSGGVLAGNYTATTFNLTGPGPITTFTEPTGIEVMPDGTAYVADLKNNDIRKIAADGTVTLFAGYVPLIPAGNPNAGWPTQEAGYVDGALSDAQFNQPAFIRADNYGNLYVSEWGAGGNRIRKISITGYTITGPTLPGGLKFDNTTGTISGSPVAKITVAQTDTITAINASGTSAATITFTPGTDLLPPHIWYASTKISAGVPVTLIPSNSGGAVPATQYGKVTLFAGSSTGQPGDSSGQDTTARFSFPQTMEMDAAGNLYVADASTNNIRKITPAGYVSDFAGSLRYFSGSKDGTGTDVLFNYPDGIAKDTSGNMYVADYSNNAIRKITRDRTVTTFYTSTATFGPGGMCFDNLGNLIVSAQDANQIWKITPAGVASVVAGSTAGYLNGDVMSAQFNVPTDVRVDTAGNIYVVDFENNAIRKITPTGLVSTFAGSDVNGNTPGFANGEGVKALFNNPTGIVRARGGVMYVADMYNNNIRRIMPDGTVGLVAGSATQVAGDADGVGTGAGFNQPDYMYIDNGGTGYVAEFGGERIRKIVLTGYSLTGTLPAGLTFDTATGIISGTPTGPITKLIDTVTAYNAAGYSTTIITFPPSSTATLANLVPNSGSLNPVFASAIKAYADTVYNLTTSITLTPTTTDSTATVTINGTPVASGTPSGDIPLQVGNNTISVIVTAQDSVTTETYTVTVYRGEPMAALDATNILTPNGDGKNDLWVIKDIQLYPQNNVAIYDKAGRTIYSKRGYSNDWDGTFKGAPLAEGTYYFEVDLGPSLRKFKGYISIVRN